MTGSTHALELLDSRQVERIVGEACGVLASTGVLVENDDAKRLLEGAGAVEAGGRFRISEDLVRAALATAPSHVLLYDRDGAPAMDAGGTRVHFDPGSAAIHILDPSTGRRRNATSSRSE